MSRRRQEQQPPPAEFKPKDPEEGLREAERRIQDAALAHAGKLDLSKLDLTWLPESLSQLTTLYSLDICHNQLTLLPESLGQLARLTYLDISENELTHLPESLSNLTNLKFLFVHHNRLTTLPDSLGTLSHLETLAAAWNRLSLLPVSIGKLTRLRTLYLFENQLTVLPETLGELGQLELLALQRNRLVSLPQSLRWLTSLKELSLHGNDALGLPFEVLGPTFGETPEKAPASPAAILDYYFRSRSGHRPLNEAKLILVGRGGVGKTCIIKRLINRTFDEHEPETPGIEIQSWDLTLPDGDKVRTHVWDFGGQEILHATHQFFLTERTLYLLVLSGREGNPTQDAEYWLQLIRSFGGDSPVIVALNRSAQHPFDVNRGLLLEKYPAIRDFVKTDCRNAPDGSRAPDGVDSIGTAELRDLIHREIGALEHRKVDFPADWFDIKERLAGMPENFITWDQYQVTCHGLGETDPQAQRDLAKYLHILGIALNYRDDPRLQDTHVLNPRWVTEGIYSLLRAGQKDKETRRGVLAAADLTTELDQQTYPSTCHDFLLRLMEKFQLCFRLQGQSERYLVPELLGEDQPGEIQALLAEPGLGFRYQYEVLPEGLLPRFIVQTHIHSEPYAQWRWRTGAVLERNGSRAVVRADARERRVDIHITGPKRPRRDLLAVIRDKFEEQHRDLKGLKVDERIPVPGEKDVTVSYQHLLDLESDGETKWRPEGMRTAIRVAELLNGVEDGNARERRRDRNRLDGLERDMAKAKKHAFLSYCHDDEAQVQQLHDDLLAAGENVWWDKNILGGQDWLQSIRRAMKESYAVVLCLSPALEQRVASGVYPEVLDAIRAYRQQAPGNIFGSSD